MLALAALAALAPAPAWAQTSWHVTTCDGGPVAFERTDALLRALALEVDGSLTATVTIALDCPGPAARVSVVSSTPDIRLEREVALATIAETLHDRVIALVVANAVDAARALARDAPPEPVAPSAPPAITALSSPALVVPAPPTPVATELTLSTGARIFVADGATALVAGHVSVRWEWLLVSVAVAGAPVGARLADIDVVVPTVQLGAVLRVAEGTLEGSIAVMGEGGMALTAGRPRLDGYVGSTAAHPVVGGLVRLAGTVRLERAIALGAAVDVGGVYGVRVAAGSDVVAYVHGLSLGITATLSWAP